MWLVAAVICKLFPQLLLADLELKFFQLVYAKKVCDVGQATVSKFRRFCIFIYLIFT